MPFRGLIFCFSLFLILILLLLFLRERRKNYKRGYLRLKGFRSLKQALLLRIKNIIKINYYL